MHPKNARLSLSVLLLAAVACPDPNSPDRLADRFVDAYYIRFDFDAAKAFASGGAIVQIEKNQELARFARDRTNLEASKARVYYEAPQRNEAGPDRVQLTYQLEIHSGDHEMQRTVLIFMARREAGWKVVRFEELGQRFDRPLPGGSGNQAEPGVRTSSSAPESPPPSKQ